VARSRLVRQAESLLGILRGRIERVGSEAEELSPEMAELMEYIEKAMNSEDPALIRNAVETLSVYLNEMAVA